VRQRQSNIRYALRNLRQNPGFTAVAILTLALGIGANTAIFTVINAVLLRPLPYAKPQELVTWRQNESLPDIDDIRSQSNRVFSAGGGVNFAEMDYTGSDEPLSIHAGYVDAGLFRVFGVSPMLGRVLSPEEDRLGGPRAVVLSWSFWKTSLSADPNVLGKSIPLSGNRYTVVGVMPASFNLPIQVDLDVFLSLRVAYPEAAKYRGVHFLRSFWRLQPGVTLAQAFAALAVVDKRLAAIYPAEEKNRHTVPVPLQQWVTGNIRQALWLLFGAVTLVLLIACVNFASLLTARAVSRRREMVVRAALGSTRGRLIQQALTESLLLAALGGTSGFLLAVAATRLLVLLKPTALAQLNAISIDPSVVAFSLAVSLLTGLIFGMAAAWSTSRPEIASSLKEETRAASAGRANSGFRKLLVIAEMAMALVLLAGAGLLIKGFARLRGVDPGFNPTNLLSIYIQLPATRFAEIPRQTSFRRELLARLQSLPGIQAALIEDFPLTDSEVEHSLAIEGRPPVPIGDEPEVDANCTMGDYFRVMQIPLRSGRFLSDMDRENQPLVAVVNEALARQYFAQQNPIGQRIRWARDTGAPRWMTIVGVVADTKQFSLAEPAFPAVFIPFAQSNEPWRRWMSVALRMPDSSGKLIPQVKRQIWSLDNQIPLNRMLSMQELLRVSLAERRFNMFLLALFAALATTLTAIGIYGVMSYGTAQRTHEFGIRMAMGARNKDVLSLVIQEGARLAAVGLGVGIFGALALTRFMKGLLFGVTPTDPTIFICVALLMTAVVLAACCIPARRAMRVDPLVALRHE
jgi:putative ABC transport system permease protein